MCFNVGMSLRTRQDDEWSNPEKVYQMVLRAAVYIMANKRNGRVVAMIRHAGLLCWCWWLHKNVVLDCFAFSCLNARNDGVLYHWWRAQWRGAGDDGDNFYIFFDCYFGCNLLIYMGLYCNSFWGLKKIIESNVYFLVEFTLINKF